MLRLGHNLLRTACSPVQSQSVGPLSRGVIEYAGWTRHRHGNLDARPCPWIRIRVAGPHRRLPPGIDPDDRCANWMGCDPPLWTLPAPGDVRLNVTDY